MFGAGTEFWYISLYAKKFEAASPAASAIYTATMPVMLFKQLCNIVQAGVAMATVLEYDAQQRGMPSPPSAKPKLK